MSPTVHAPHSDYQGLVVVAIIAGPLLIALVLFIVAAAYKATRWRLWVWRWHRARAARPFVERMAETEETVERAIPGFVAAFRKQQRENEREDLDGLVFETREQNAAELIAIETVLAARLGLTGDVRAHLIQIDRDNALVEDDVVADWHRVYSSFVDWQHEEQIR